MTTMKFRIIKPEAIKELVLSFIEKTKSGEMVPFYDSDEKNPDRKIIGKILSLKTVDNGIEFEAEITDEKYFKIIKEIKK